MTHRDDCPVALGGYPCQCKPKAAMTNGMSDTERAALVESGEVELLRDALKVDKAASKARRVMQQTEKVSP